MYMPFHLRARPKGLREARWLAGLSQAELAAAVHVSRKTIWSLEQRRSLPSVTLALALARTLEARVEDLFEL